MALGLLGSALAGGLAGLGQGASFIGKDMIETDNRSDLMKQQRDGMIEGQKQIADYNAGIKKKADDDFRALRASAIERIKPLLQDGHTEKDYYNALSKEQAALGLMEDSKLSNDRLKAIEHSEYEKEQNVIRNKQQDRLIDAQRQQLALQGAGVARANREEQLRLDDRKKEAEKAGLLGGYLAGKANNAPDAIVNAADIYRTELMTKFGIDPAAKNPEDKSKISEVVKVLQTERDNSAPDKAKVIQAQIDSLLGTVVENKNSTAKPATQLPKNVPASGSVVTVTSQDEVAKLPAGARFMGPDGRVRIKPN